MLGFERDRVRVKRHPEGSRHTHSAAELHAASDQSTNEAPNQPFNQSTRRAAHALALTPQDDVNNFGATNPLTRLVPSLDGIDPDDAFSAVPYEKGLALLNCLTTVCGSRKKFECFAAHYIATFKRTTLTSAVSERVPKRSSISRPCSSAARSA